MCWQLWVRIICCLSNRHPAQVKMCRLRSASSLDFLPILLFKGLVRLRGVLNLGLPSFLLSLWSSGSTYAQVH